MPAETSDAMPATPDMPQIGPFPDTITSSEYIDDLCEFWMSESGLAEAIGFEDYLLYNLASNSGTTAEKPLGYIPMRDLVASGPVGNKFMNYVVAESAEARVFSEEECHVSNGACYTFKRQALQALLDANQDTLDDAGWPRDVDGFVTFVEAVNAPPHTPLFDLVADSFADTRNPLRQQKP